MLFLLIILFIFRVSCYNKIQVTIQSHSSKCHAFRRFGVSAKWSFLCTLTILNTFKKRFCRQTETAGLQYVSLFLPGRDEAVIEHCVPSELHRGDVILYRRVQGILVLHRICRITRDGFYLVGDNQTEVEGPLSPEQIHGKLTGVVRNGKSFSVSYPIYRMLSSIWLFLRPVRPFFWSVTAFFRRFFQKH